MKFKFRSFYSTVAIILSLATLVIHSSAEYEDDISTNDNESLDSAFTIDDEHLVKCTMNDEEQEDGCLHSVLYTFDNTTMTIEDVYEQNTVSALLDDIAYYSDNHYAVILKEGTEVSDGYLEEGMVVQVYHSDQLYGEYTIGELLKPSNIMLLSTEDFIKPLDDLNTSKHLTCRFNCEYNGQLCEWCKANGYNQLVRANPHNGQDIAWSTIDGKTIRAVKDGTVIARANTSATSGWGSYIKIDHGDGLVTLYAHMQYNSPNVKYNQKISKGTAIGKVGNTGQSYGTHLHISVYKDGVAVNPKTYLENATTYNAPVNTYKIVNGAVTIRANPTTTSTSYGTIADGTSVSISNIEIGNGTYVFGKISSGSYQGKWISLGTTTGEIYAVNMSDVWYVYDGPLYVRSTSSTNSANYGAIANGSSFKLSNVVVSGNYVMGQIASSPNPTMASGSTCTVSNAKGSWVALNYCAPYVD